MLGCDDSNNYVVKGRQVGRAIVNDHVVAKLGLALGAPVGSPRLVEVPRELIQVERQLSHFQPGLAHGTLFIEGCRDSYRVEYLDQNRERFGLLWVLYSWVYARDIQFLYETAEPHHVYSVDHGHFIFAGPDWKARDLASCPAADCDPILEYEESMKAECGLTGLEQERAVSALQAVSETEVVQAVASPPDEWIRMPDRIAMVEYLIKRRQQVLSQFGLSQ